MRHRASRRNVVLSYADVAACSTMVGFGETYFAAFALAVGLSEVAAGLLGTLPMLAAGLLQLLAPHGPRLCGSFRRWVVGCVTLQGLSFVPLAFAAGAGAMSAGALYVVVTLYYLSGMAAGSAWCTWIDGIIPRRVFGGFLAKRARITQLAAFGAFLAGGALLNRGAETNATLLAFLALFAAAGSARLISSFLLAEHDDLSWRERPVTRLPWRDLAGSFLNPGKSRFLLFLLVNQVSLAVAGPFFAPFFLARMKYSYAAYAAIIGASYLAKVAFYPAIGAFVRKVGPYRALWLSGICVSPLPLLWFLTPQVIVICLVQIVAGIAWGTFELASTMLQFDRLDPKERLQVLTAYTALNAGALAVGSVIGGWALSMLGEGVGYPVIFTASAFARAASLLTLAPPKVRSRSRRVEVIGTVTEPVMEHRQAG